MKIVFITPPFDLMGKGYGSKKYIRAGFFPPLGVGYLAAPLVKMGHQVKIIDCPPLNYGNEKVGEDLKLYQPDLIGISTLTASAEEAYSLIKYLKKIFPNIPIIFGGPHISCFPEETINKVPEVDCLVYGEGEITFPKIIESLEKNGYFKNDIPGIWYKDKNGRFTKNPPAEPIMNLDDLLPPAWQLYDMSIYMPLPLMYQKLPVANLITSRGCPWGKCKFCFESGRASQKYRRHSPKRVVDDIKTLVYKFGINEIAFWDDNFLVNQNWIFEFCDLLDKEKLKIPWSAYGRVNTVTKPMLERAKIAGLWCVFYGFETGNEDLLKRINKGITLEQSRQAAKWANELGLDVRGSFMLALPGETPAKALKTIEFAKELDIPFAQFLLTYPEWGTELYNDAISSGKIVPAYLGRTNVAYIPEGYKDASEVRKMQKKAYQSFYFNPRFIWKHLKRLKSWNKIKQYYLGLKFILGVSS